VFADITSRKRADVESSSAVAGYLQKPFAMSVLLAEVRRALARERPLSE
jgi:DNA-binding response OmpR family regulator